MKRAGLVLLVFGMFGTCSETLAAQCSSIYISEITVVSVHDNEGAMSSPMLGSEKRRTRPRRTFWGPALTLGSI